MLEIVFFNILLTSIMSAMLIILIFLVKVIFKEKLSAKWHYYIWLILVIRLIIPYTPEFSPKMNDIFPQIKDNVRIQAENHTIGLDANSNTDSKNENEKSNYKYNTNYNSEAIDEKDVPLYSRVEEKNNGKWSLTILGIASKIWVMGIFFFLFYLIFINCIMYYKIKKSSEIVQSCGIQNILDECRKLVNIVSHIPVIYQKHIKTPAICGVFKPKMLIPVNILNQLSPDETKYVVLHELCHFKRRDTVIGMLQILICILYWFNPLIWYASCKMKSDREPVCDELVLSYLKPAERRSYAETLIKMLKCFSESHWTYITANMSQGSLENMEWRLKLINILKKRSVILGIVMALVTAALGAASVLAINSHLSYAYPVNSTSVSPVNTNKAVTLITAADKKLLTRGEILDRNGKELEEGLYGIEQYMDQCLKLKVNNVGIKGKNTLEGGMNVVLTIDAGIQGIVEKALDKAVEEYKTKNGAAALVINPKSGEILAMASRPEAGIVTDSKNGEIIPMVSRPYLVDTTWKNKSLTDTFEPGSTFKAITSAVLLEEGIVTPETPVDDSPVSVSGYNINCWNTTELHGKQTFKEAVYNSCNPVFVRAVQNLGTDKFYTYLRNFGFYDKTALELPGEAESIIPTKPAEIDMELASFGQRFQITPIQLASAYCAIANGGKLMKPQIVKQIVNTGNSTVETYKPQLIRNVISPKTSESMKEILEGVVSNGTASSAYIKGYKFAGFAGTGEKGNGRYIASFAGFAPADNPQIVCMIILDEPMVNAPTGGATAAPAAGKLMRDIIDYIQ